MTSAPSTKRQPWVVIAEDAEYYVCSREVAMRQRRDLQLSAQHAAAGLSEHCPNLLGMVEEARVMMLKEA